MTTIQLSDSDKAIIKKVVIPALKDMPGGVGTTDEEDEALWTLIEKLQKASEE